MGPLGFDVWLVHRACQGLGMHEYLLVEVLVSRTNEDLEILKAEYAKTYHKDMVHVIERELTFKTERMFKMILAVSLSLEGH